VNGGYVLRVPVDAVGEFRILTPRKLASSATKGATWCAGRD